MIVTTKPEPAAKTDAPRTVERPRILFTEGASLSARQTLYPLGGHCIRSMSAIRIRCASVGSPGSFGGDFLSPSFSEEAGTEFLRFLARKIRTHHYDVLLPTHEQVYLLSRFRDAFTPHVGLALPEFSALERMQNKAEFSRLLMNSICRSLSRSSCATRDRARSRVAVSVLLEAGAQHGRRRRVSH